MITKVHVKLIAVALFTCAVVAIPVENNRRFMATTSAFAASSVTASDAKARQVDQFFAAFIDKNSPGAAVIVTQNGKVLYKAAYGLADIEENILLTPQHIFHIASVGKQFTSEKPI